MQRGYIALITVLVILAVVTVLAATITLSAISEAQSGFALSRGENTLQFVEGCTEDALLKARADVTYNGGQITRPEGTCIIDSPITKNGTEWTMKVSTQSTTYKRYIQVIFNRLPTGITLVSWKELAS